jgi:long-subunit acyl-CoA synthetase (AMP-forming)
LPLPHVFERVLAVALTYQGAFIVYVFYLYRPYSGDITKLKDDAAFVKPTLLIGVPRIFNRIV